MACFYTNKKQTAVGAQIFLFFLMFCVRIRKIIERRKPWPRL